MRRILSFLGVVALACGGHFVCAANLTFQVETTHNLEYQLDCLSGVIRCTERNMTLTVEAADESWLASWRHLRYQSIDVRAPAQPFANTHLPLPTAGDLSHVPSRYRPRTAGKIGQAAYSRQQVLAHFKQRFARTWTDNDAAHLTRLKLALMHLSNASDVQASMDLAATLFELPDRQIPPIQLIATRQASAGSLATIGRSGIFVETPRNERAHNRLPVIVHEVIHWWQSEMVIQQQAALIAAFMSSESECVLPAYHFFDEALATAIGNGLIERVLTTPDQFSDYLALPLSFYADDTIDSIAKALLPLVEQYAAASKKMDRYFIEQYVSIAETTLGSTCNMLASELRSVAFLFADKSLLPLASIAQRKWQTQLAFSDVLNESDITALDQYVGLSAVIVTTHHLIDQFPSAMSTEIRQVTESNSGRFVFAEPMAPHATRYWVVADTLAGAAGTFLQLIALQQNQFDGIWVPPALPSTKQKIVLE